ncbi:MAG: hypothetical protein ABEJ66_00100 [Candidatus Nanohaloarchaea archaeon]
MKGQTQALTAVLITTITVGTVATAYVWGAPLLEKRQSKAQLDELERSIKNLRSEIVSVARSGSGTTAKVTLQLDDGARLEVNEQQDYIDITTQAPAPPYPAGTWTLLEGNSLQNLTIGSGSYAVKSSDLPAVLAVRVASGAGGSMVTYRIETRNMYARTASGPVLEKIDLDSVGRRTATGKTTIFLTNTGDRQDSIETATGETLERKITEVKVDIR